MPTEIPWYKSKIIVGAIVSILAKLLVATGLVGDLAPGDAEELTNLIVLIVGGIGDVVAISARVVQKQAPSITANTTTLMGRHHSWAFAFLLIPLFLGLSGCNTGVTKLPPPPVAVADSTTLDEQAARSVELAYTAASRAATISIRAGLVTDPATIRRIGELDRRAYALVLSVRAAYRAGNSANYTTAVIEARTAVASILSAF